MMSIIEYNNVGLNVDRSLGVGLIMLQVPIFYIEYLWFLS